MILSSPNTSAQETSGLVSDVERGMNPLRQRYTVHIMLPEERGIHVLMRKTQTRFVGVVMYIGAVKAETSIKSSR